MFHISCSIILTRSEGKWCPKGWKCLYIYPVNWFVLSHSAAAVQCVVSSAPACRLLLHQLNEKLSSANPDCFTADVNTMIWHLRLHLRQEELLCPDFSTIKPGWLGRLENVKLIKTENIKEPAGMNPCSLSQDPWICKDCWVFVFLSFLNFLLCVYLDGYSKFLLSIFSGSIPF